MNRGGGNNNGGNGRGQRNNPVPVSRWFLPFERVVLPTTEKRLVDKFFLLHNELRDWVVYVKDSGYELWVETVRLWDRIYEYLQYFMELAATIFVTHTRQYLRGEMDIRVWKYGIYAMHNILRELFLEDNHPQDLLRSAKVALKSLYTLGINHYNYIIAVMDDVLNVDLGDVRRFQAIFMNSYFPDRDDWEPGRVIYRLFITLGDIHRHYADCFLSATHKNLAVKNYHLARHFDSVKGRAFHQLGMIAKSDHDILGMTFYFIRASDGTPSPQGLTTQLSYVFDGVTKQYLSYRSKFWLTQMNCTGPRFQHNNGSPSKFEIWISRKDCYYKSEEFPIPLSRREHLDSLTETEVRLYFCTSVAAFIGICFTNISTEMLNEVSWNMFVHFEGLVLKKKATFEDTMQAFGLLIYMHDYYNHAALVEWEDGQRKTPVSETHYGYLRNLCLSAINRLVILVCEGLTKIFKNMDWKNPQLDVLTAALHLWCYWIQKHEYIITKLRYTFRRNRQHFANNWATDNGTNSELLLTKVVMLRALSRLYAEMALLGKVRGCYVFPFLNSKKDERYSESLGYLQETLLLEGFGGIINTTSYCTAGYFFKKDKSKALAIVHWRIIGIHKFVFCHFNAMRKFVKETSMTNRIPLKYPLDMYIEANYAQLDFIQKRKQAPLRTEIPKATLMHTPKRWPDCNNAHVIVKNPPKARQQLADIRNAEMSFVPPISKTYEIWSDLMMSSVRVELVVCPEYVVIDTNCFIDDLESVIQLTKILQYPKVVVVTSTVLKELRNVDKIGKTLRLNPKDQAKLQKKSAAEKTDMMVHKQYIGSRAEQAIWYMQNQRGSFKVVTVAGRTAYIQNLFVDPIHDEWVNPNSGNDDKIMETCMYLEQSLPPKNDSPLKIHRDVILLTGDRSLRVRANAQDIPTRGIRTFISWYQASLLLNECGRMMNSN